MELARRADSATPVPSVSSNETHPVSGSSFSEAILALRSSLLVVHRVARPLEALVYAPAEAGSAAQTVPQEGRARLAALGDDLVQLILQAEAASG